MDTLSAAECLAELGNATRLHIVRFLVKAGETGAAVGDIQRHLGVPASTLSHHINHLVRAGLLRQQREGRVLRCTANFDLVNDLAEFLVSECCVGIDGAPADSEDAA